MIFVGIDPGITGGIAALERSGEVMHCKPLQGLDGTLDVHELCQQLDHLAWTSTLGANGVSVWVEKVGAMPGQGVSSTFKFGTTYGMIQGALAAKGFSFSLVTPQAWTKVMLAGEDKSDKKERAKLVARRLFPALDLKGSERARTVHSGMADALLIAEYARRSRAVS